MYIAYSTYITEKIRTGSNPILDKTEISSNTIPSFVIWQITQMESVLYSPLIFDAQVKSYKDSQQIQRTYL